MKTTLVTCTLIAAGALLVNSTHAQTLPANVKKALADTAKSAAASAPKKTSIADKTKGNKKMEGLFTVYLDTANGNTQIFVSKGQLGKKYIYQSFSENGPASLGLNKGTYRDNAVICIKKYYDRLEFQRMNTNFYYDPANPVSKSADVNQPEAIFLTEKIVAEDSTGYLVSGDGLFMGEKLDQIKPTFPPGIPPGAVFNLGGLNPGKSQLVKVRAYPLNTDVVVDLAYDNPMPFNGGGKDIADARFNRIRVQHSFLELPEDNFKPRLDDPRVGFFTEEVTDQTSISPTPFRDMIHRWNLVKKDPSAALSEPVTPITWYIENTTPVEYRDVIKAAGEKWNEAFEKAGFKNAVVMKVQPDTATWEAGDIRYNVIRWVSSPYPAYGAYGPSFVNPLSGEILGADIMVEWYSGSFTPVYDEIFNNPGSPAMAGSNLPLNVTTATFAGATQPAQQALANSAKPEMCNMAAELKMQFLTGVTALEAAGAPDNELKEMHKQFLYYLILHEMGHTMGLMHNMKASQMLSPAEINNTEITHKLGLQGSVMDYPAINVSLDRSKQGDYYTTKPGPYDLWAIEFAYTPTASETEEAAFRKRILARSNEPGLMFGNDADDMRAAGKAIDPRVNVNDLTSDAVGYADDRFKLVNLLMGKLKTKYARPDASYAELRARYNLLNGQRNSMIAAVSRYIGGVYIDRSFVGETGATKPYTPVPLAYQKKAMDVLARNVFAPNAFDADAQVIPYLQTQRRGFNFFSTTEDPKVTAVYNTLAVGAISHLLHAQTLQRITATRLYGNQYTAVDVLNDLTRAIFDADINGNVNVYRQYLQTTYVKALAQMLAERGGYDDIAQAAARNTLKKLKAKLTATPAANEEVKAHRGNLVFLIDDATTVK
ncbi:zinc-dependent metalloprotease [Deminuibacter soli]|uniref:DUF5117 domain-containing protein n=1 Tax=Deminuibacter soli TaxID=2291815 RepID=A0A3E1NHI4_9BACT|nr:zinc-dependent metalloprotease [Deminuibacter soli]RFM27367.1 DUF5117 domain-containing protein [Deminuibacter soli]